MKCKISLRQRTSNCLTINHDFDLFGVELGSELVDYKSIYGNPPRFDEVIGPSSASNSRVGDDLI
jgi:hypothetical protein